MLTLSKSSVSTYPIDPARMADTQTLDDDAETRGPKEFSIIEYAKRSFGMYSGQPVNATIAFGYSLVSVVLDHFGSDTKLIDCGDGRFTISAHVSASPVFLGWMFQLGNKAEILAPESLRDAMRCEIVKIGGLYK